MSNDLKPELSKKNQWWIDRHRYYELKHFCLQWQKWAECLRSIDGYGHVPAGLVEKVTGNHISDPVERAVEAREVCTTHMELVQRAAKETDEFFTPYILRAVTQGLTYEHMRLCHNLPCNRGEWYTLYRKFFWTLDKFRK